MLQFDYAQMPVFVEVKCNDGSIHFIERTTISQIIPSDDGLYCEVRTAECDMLVSEPAMVLIGRMSAIVIPLPVEVKPLTDEPFDYFGTKMHPVKSSNIKAIGWRSDTNVMTVAFLSDEVYTYEPVSQEQFDAFMGAESHGKYLNQTVKPAVRAGTITCTKVGALS